MAELLYAASIPTPRRNETLPRQKTAKQSSSGVNTPRSQFYGTENSSRFSVSSYASSFLSISTGRPSMEGATWRHSLNITANSGFGASGVPRSEGYKGVREGREKGGFLPRILGVGRTGKAPAPVPQAMIDALRASASVVVKGVDQNNYNLPSMSPLLDVDEDAFKFSDFTSAPIPTAETTSGDPYRQSTNNSADNALSRRSSTSLDEGFFEETRKDVPTKAKFSNLGSSPPDSISTLRSFFDCTEEPEYKTKWSSLGERTLSLSSKTAVPEYKRYRQQHPLAPWLESEEWSDDESGGAEGKDTQPSSTVAKTLYSVVSLRAYHTAEREIEWGSPWHTYTEGEIFQVVGGGDGRILAWRRNDVTRSLGWISWVDFMRIGGDPVC